MTNPAPRVAPVDWSIQQVQIAGVTIAVARLTVSLFVSTAQPGHQYLQETCWLDTCAPLSVVPHHVHSGRLAWQPIGVQATWAGQTCDLGKIDVYLQESAGAPVEGPFPMLAKFARSDPPGDPVPLLIGLEFLMSLTATTLIPPPPQSGEIQYP